MVPRLGGLQNQGDSGSGVSASMCSGDKPVTTDADVSIWSFAPAGPVAGAGFTAAVRYVAGDEGQRRCHELAMVVDELMAWAADDPVNGCARPEVV